MRGHYVDLTNKRFNRLVVKRRISNLGKRARWMCICDCGKEHNVLAENLRAGSVKSCGCLNKELLRKIKTKHGLCGTTRYNMFRAAKIRAKKINLSFSLTLKDIPNIPDFCPILSIPIKVKIGKGHSDNSPTLDRIVPSLGYIKTNIRIISARANVLKSNATYEELKRILEDASAIRDSIRNIKSNISTRREWLASNYNSSLQKLFFPFKSTGVIHES